MTSAHEDARTFLRGDTVTVVVEAAWNGRSYNVQSSGHGVEVAGNLFSRQSSYSDQGS